MQWKPFFTEFIGKLCLDVKDRANFGIRKMVVNTRLVGQIAQTYASDGHFGEDVHAADLGGHPEVGALFLDPHNRRLAADPAFLA